MDSPVGYVLRAPSSLEKVALSMPTPRDGEMIIRMRRANVCGSDVNISRGLHPHVGVGCIMGHEGMGEVLDTGGSSVIDSRGVELGVGDRVAMTYTRFCGQCRQCDRGQDNLCSRAFSGWSTPAGEWPFLTGTFATHYFVTSAQAVYRVPDGVSDATAAGANCGLSQSFYAVELAAVSPGETAIVHGAGGLGLFAASMLRERGVHVIVSDISEDRLRNAEKFGAHQVLNVRDQDPVDTAHALREITNDQGADVAIEVAGAPAIFASGFLSLRPGGRYVSIGNVWPGQTVPVDPGALTRTGVTVLSGMRYPSRTLGKALDFVARNTQYEWDDMYDKVYTFEQIPEALEDSAAKTVTRAAIVIA